MSDAQVTRSLLVIASPSSWIPSSPQPLGPWVLEVERVSSLEAVPGAASAWDVVAFRVDAVQPRPPDQALEILRGLAPNATFLPVATDPDPKEALFYLKNGAYEYLEEPLDRDTFLRSLHEAIDNRDTFQEILDLNRTLEAQKAQLLEEKAELERVNRELSAVSRLARSLASSLEVEEIVGSVQKSIGQTLRCHRVAVGLINPKTLVEEGSVRSLARASTSWDERAETVHWTLRDKGTHPWLQTVLVEGRPLHVTDPAQHPLTQGTPVALVHRNAFVKVPMVTHGRVIGSITVETEGPGQTLDAEELSILGIFADTAAMALENARLYHSMRELSVRDELTGLYNRRHLLKQLEAEWDNAERHDLPLSVLILDIDHFKQLNDGNDHLTGDEALRALAETLIRNTRGIDTVARYGGEEFVVVLPRTDPRNGRRVAEKLRSIVEASPFPGERAVPGGSLTVSLGLGCRTAGVTSARQLLEHADWALYRAKTGGRNRVCAWDPQEEPATVGVG